MGSRKTSHRNKKKEKLQKPIAEKGNRDFAKAVPRKRLEVILKCDTSGCIEAIISSIQQ